LAFSTASMASALMAFAISLCAAAPALLVLATPCSMVTAPNAQQHQALPRAAFTGPPGTRLPRRRSGPRFSAGESPECAVLEANAGARFADRLQVRSCAEIAPAPRTGALGAHALNCAPRPEANVV